MEGLQIKDFKWKDFKWRKTSRNVKALGIRGKILNNNNNNNTLW